MLAFMKKENASISFGFELYQNLDEKIWALLQNPQNQQIIESIIFCKREGFLF